MKHFEEHNITRCDAQAEAEKDCSASVFGTPAKGPQGGTGCTLGYYNLVPGTTSLMAA